MKTGIKFALSAVQSGQKASTLNAAPQLIAKSTAGMFTATSPVTKTLGVAPGDSIMFLNNFSDVEKQIQLSNPDLLAYAEENGINLTSKEGVDTIISTFGSWYIAKGIAKRNKNGEPLMGNARIPRADKEQYIAEHGAEVIDALDDDERIAFAEAKGVDADDTEALIAALTPEDIPSPSVPLYTGAKTSSSGLSIGIGVQVNFTDTNIWTNLKSDIEDKGAVVRTFDVDLASPEIAEVFDGFENVKVLAYPIEFASDSEPVRRVGATDEN